MDPASLIVVVIRRPSTFSNIFSSVTTWPIKANQRIPMDPASLIVVVIRRPSTFSNIFSSVTTWPIKAKFYVEPPWKGGTKVYINSPGHMTKMAAMPIYGKKPFKNLLLQNRRADFHETWYVASGTPAHHNLYK